MIKPHRRQALWLAFILHRLSGVGLALFLPFHFYLLGLALRQTESMDSLLRWSEYPLVKIAEFVLVFLLAVHMFGGLRLLALEFLPWSDRQKSLTASAIAVSFLLAVLFLMRAY